MNSISRKKFIEAYDKYHKDIYRFLRFKVATDEIAQDLTSEVFTKAWNIIITDSKYPANDRAYLYKIARNCLVDYYRRSRQELPLLEENAISHLESNQFYSIMTAVQNLDIDQEMGHLHKALSQLSDTYAELITLKYIEDLSNKEIAKILDKSRGAVRTALSRAIAELRSKLEEA